jgi:hypothetical protein
MVIAVAAIAIMIVVSTIAVVATVPVLIAIGGHDATAEQCRESGKQHKSDFHKTLLSYPRPFQHMQWTFGRM